MNIDLSYYIEGLLDMSVSTTKSLGLSYLRADCFNKEDFEKEFQKLFRIKIPIELEETKDTKENTLFEIIRNKEITKTFIQLFDYKVDAIKNIYYPKENRKLINLLSGDQKGVSGFWFVEEVYFIETDKYIISIIIGNNE